MSSETVTKYRYGNGVCVDVVLNWQGKEPKDDPDRFYDFFDSETGRHLNEGEPWHDEGEGTPTSEEVAILVRGQ